MISQDVIHSFFVPAFRVKQDVLPGRYTTLWFEANTPGDYRLYCAEYCGTDHSRMVGRIVVQSPADHAAWLAGATGSTSPRASGAELFTQFQCATCHLPEGQRGRGPSLAGIHGQRAAALLHQQFDDGQSDSEPSRPRRRGPEEQLRHALELDRRQAEAVVRHANFVALRRRPEARS